MTSIWDYNKTPTSNTGSPPTGFGTGQAPSNVRVMLQDILGEVTEFVNSTVAGGTADALTVTFTNVPAAPSTLVDGMEIHIRAAAANVTTTPTLAVNGGTARTITKGGGVALVAGDIAGNLAEMDLRYNLANTRWELLNPAKGGAASVTGPSSSTDGDVALFNGATGLIIKDSGFTLGQLLRWYLAGGTLSTAGGSGTMSMTATTSMSDDQTTMMVTAAFSKTTASWAVGSGNGGLDTGAIANSTWYHFFQIKRTDTGVTDWIFSLSASAPTLPANYTKQRRIFSWVTDGSAHWIAGTQTGDWQFWKASVLDQNAIAASATPANAIVTVPPGINVMWRGIADNAAGVAAQQLWVYTPLMNDEAAAGNEATVNSQGANSAEVQVDVVTDTTQHVRWVSSGANGTNSLRSIGYQDYARRGS